MANSLRVLTEKGLQTFRLYLADLRGASAGRPPWEILTDSSYSGKFTGELELERRVFRDKLQMAKYLHEKFRTLSASRIDSNTGFWSWLSLFYFDEVCPISHSGRRIPGQDSRHILDPDFRRYYRHLLHGPYTICRLHGERAPLLLHGPLDKASKYYEELCSRQGFITNQGKIEAANLLYFDHRRGRPKYGPGGISRKPGTLLRYIDVVQQLDLTHDLYSMTGEEVLSLLPSEFDEWLPKEGVKDLLLNLIKKGNRRTLK